MVIVMCIFQNSYSQDKKVLTAKATPLDELMQKHGLQYTIHPRAHTTEIILKQNSTRIGSVEYNNSASYEPCYIKELWVDQAFRAKGLGTALLNRAMEDLETTGGCHKIYLWAHPFNLKEGEKFEFMLEKLKKYYERFGFKPYLKKHDYMRYVSLKKPMPDYFRRLLKCISSGKCHGTHIYIPEDNAF